MLKQSQQLPAKRVTTSKIVLSFVALMATAVVGSAGIANAAQPDKPTKAQCTAAGFTNHGQCVKEWAQKKNHPGGGYGGNSSVVVNNDTNLEVNGNNNVITIIIRNITNIFS